MGTLFCDVPLLATSVHPTPIYHIYFTSSICLFIFSVVRRTTAMPVHTAHSRSYSLLCRNFRSWLWTNLNLHICNTWAYAFSECTLTVGRKVCVWGIVQRLSWWVKGDKISFSAAVHTAYIGKGLASVARELQHLYGHGWWQPGSSRLGALTAMHICWGLLRQILKPNGRN